MVRKALVALLRGPGGHKAGRHEAFMTNVFLKKSKEPVMDPQGLAGSSR